MPIVSDLRFGAIPVQKVYLNHKIIWERLKLLGEAPYETIVEGYIGHNVFSNEMYAESYNNSKTFGNFEIIIPDKPLANTNLLVDNKSKIKLLYVKFLKDEANIESECEVIGHLSYALEGQYATQILENTDGTIDLMLEQRLNAPDIKLEMNTLGHTQLVLMEYLNGDLNQWINTSGHGDYSKMLDMYSSAKMQCDAVCYNRILRQKRGTFGDSYNCSFNSANGEALIALNNLCGINNMASSNTGHGYCLDVICPQGNLDINFINKATTLMYKALCFESTSINKTDVVGYGEVLNLTTLLGKGNYYTCNSAIVNTEMAILRQANTNISTEGSALLKLLHMFDTQSKEKMSVSATAKDLHLWYLPLGYPPQDNETPLRGDGGVVLNANDGIDISKNRRKIKIRQAHTVLCDFENRVLEVK